MACLGNGILNWYLADSCDQESLGNNDYLGDTVVLELKWGTLVF